MKKALIVSGAILFVCFAAVFSPQASAAGLDGVIDGLIGQERTAAQIQDIVNIKQNFDKGDKHAAWAGVIKTVLQNSGKSDLVALASDQYFADDVKVTLRKKLGQTLDEKLAPYGRELNIAAALLNLRHALYPNALQDSNALSSPPSGYKEKLDMTATAYAPGYADNGKWNDKTYMGGIVRKGVAAVDPAVIPMGSKLWIEGYGQATAEDQGSAIKGKRIDLAFNSRQEALDYGIQQHAIYVLQ